MDWREKSVTLGNVNAAEFDTRLARVTVSENRILVEFKDVQDWKRIEREVGAETVLQEVYWDEVVDVDVTQQHLYYPHIDVTVAAGDREEERRLYFVEDEQESLQDCLKAIKRFWNAWLQRRSSSGSGYSYQEQAADQDDEAGDAEEDSAEDADEDDADEEHEDDEEDADAGVDHIVDGFLDE